MKTKPQKQSNSRNERPISLHPLTRDEALRRAMQAGKPMDCKDGATNPVPDAEPPEATDPAPDRP